MISLSIRIDFHGRPIDYARMLIVVLPDMVDKMMYQHG